MQLLSDSGTVFFRRFRLTNQLLHIWSKNVASSCRCWTCPMAVLLVQTAHTVCRSRLALCCDLADAVIALVSHQKLPSGMHADALGLVESSSVSQSIAEARRCGTTRPYPVMPLPCTKLAESLQNYFLELLSRLLIQCKPVSGSSPRTQF